MSLELIAYEINEAYAHYGMSTYITPTKMIINAILATVIIFYLIKSGIFFKIMDKYFPHESILMFMGLALFAMIIMKEMYIYLLVILIIIGFFYIIFTNKKYETYKNILENLINKIL